MKPQTTLLSTCCIALLLSGCNLLAEVAENPDAGKVCGSGHDPCSVSSPCCGGFACLAGTCEFNGAGPSTTSGGSSGSSTTRGTTGAASTSGGSTRASSTGNGSSGTSGGSCLAQSSPCGGAAQGQCCGGLNCCGDLNPTCIAGSCQEGSSSSGGTSTGGSSSGGSTSGGTTGGSCVAQDSVCDGSAPCCGNLLCCGDLNTVCVPANQCPGGGSTSGSSTSGGSTGGGSTGAACTAGGSCVPTNPCDEGTITCTPVGPVCVDDLIELSNGTPCGSGYFCSAGGCIDSCLINGTVYANNASDPNDPCELCVTFQSTTSWTPQTNGVACGSASNFACQNGACVSSCSTGETGCNGTCTNTGTDPQNCGGCGQACLAGQSCSNASCQNVTTADLLTPQLTLGVASLPGQIWAIGGRDVNRNPISTVEIYDIASNSWSYGSSLQTARELIAAAVDQTGTVWAIGGYSSSGATNVVEVNTNSLTAWQYGPSITTARDGLEATTGLDGTVYAIGGYNGSYLTTVETLSPGSNAWVTGVSMPTGRWCPTVVTAQDGRIFVMGGKNGGSGSGFTDTGALTTVEAYSPTTSSWATLPSLPAATIEAGAAVATDGRIFVFGGYSDNGYLANVQVYDPAANSWSTAASLPVTSDDLAGTLGSDGRIYAVAGGGDSGGSLMWAYTESVNAWW